MCKDEALLGQIIAVGSFIGPASDIVGAPPDNTLLPTQDWLAGDAVVIAPVSIRIPANREFYREIGRAGGSGDTIRVENHCAAGTFCVIPYAD